MKMSKILNKEIAEHRKADQKFKETMEIKSQFISMVSHELRTPLTAIKESIAIVLDGLAGTINEEQKDFLGAAKRNVDRLARLINDVLDFQKLESGRAVFNIHENDINEIVWEIQQAMAPLAKEKGLNFITEPDENLPLVKFDRDKITQVLTNLVDNAIKFTEEGSITIATSRRNNTIQVSVKDTGQEIKKEDIQKLFHKFEQLTKDRNKGTGLGLAISKEIIEKHNGKIWAESKPGRGVTFCVALPVVERRK